MKKYCDLFDITMGAYDGAEVCELVGTFIKTFSNYNKSNIGPYRDDEKRKNQPRKNVSKSYIKALSTTS